ncbi:hypothetical protein B296_00045764 [Ensete ventricosum]|uniref:Poly [ADP-ribose] polymerase n=1 Tax=Ensete ventricosum TaxID=4639 RepID=A0A426XPU3_ENSVE|nr:hypothetical protein B296_00045764 [Ensete ventricosum]
MTGATIDDPLSDRYGRLGCSVAPLDKESDDHKMILKYLDTTYEPIEVGGVDAKELEEEKVSVKGLGRKKPDESQHFKWADDVKVPCGRLVASEHNSDRPLEYNEYAVYDPKQVCTRFVVAVKYEEQNEVVMAVE